jgi:hypothetical protein
VQAAPPATRSNALSCPSRRLSPAASTIAAALSPVLIPATARRSRSRARPRRRCRWT